MGWCGLLKKDPLLPDEVDDSAYGKIWQMSLEKAVAYYQRQ